MVDYIKSDVYFSIVPEWVIDSPIPAQLERAFALFCRYAKKDIGPCFPSISTLASRINVSDSTIKRALKELKSIGAIKSEKRFDKATGEQTSNLYTVYRSSRVIDDRPHVKDDTSPSSSETYKLESSNQSNILEDRKKLWRALTEAIGYEPTTQVERGGWNKCIKELREAGVTAEEIPNRVETYKKLFVGMTLTPFALVKHWSLLSDVEEKKPKKHDCKVDGHEFRDTGYTGYDLHICIFCQEEKRPDVVN